MLNLSTLSFQELRRLAEHQAYKESTDAASRAYILELLNRASAQAQHLSSDYIYGSHNRIEGV